ncbi:MAG: Hsp20/alpha crystallin family protein [Candidatus Moeniiplasma glomeromycotorum]|nr:Hsp20/alpha crystallin family protein [Candidatus Moeniiplasma glomeromycotorum]MCE8167162.1 Hsp20/alpha crystallin family protein [Candidatus Moeniiplasma glomeromycotorum]MCE8168826.1 Hsp20/alpha crystallin family protein [Candidatus Moeniiplasma glomeromycotorum]
MSNIQRKKPHHGQKYLWGIQEVLDKWANEVMDLDNNWWTNRDSLSTKTEITEDEKNYYYILHVPGIKKEDIKIEIEDHTLRVSGERKEKKENIKKHYSEISYGFFSREFILPKSIEKEAIRANEKNGEYVITVPKSLQNKARRIEIEE